VEANIAFVRKGPVGVVVARWSQGKVRSSTPSPAESAGLAPLYPSSALAPLASPPRDWPCCAVRRRHTLVRCLAIASLMKIPRLIIRSTHRHTGDAGCTPSSRYPCVASEYQELPASHRVRYLMQPSQHFNPASTLALLHNLRQPSAWYSWSPSCGSRGITDSGQCCSCPLSTSTRIVVWFDLCTLACRASLCMKS
jgi:hypothetical protein